MHKATVIEKRIESLVDQGDVRQVMKFSRAIGRRFDRFAFPDEVVYWIQPLQTVIRKRALKEAGELFRPLQSIEELRLRSATGWGEDPPFDLTLMVILKAGTLPPPNVVEELQFSLSDLEDDRPLGEIAAEMPPEGSSHFEVVSFWERFGYALAKMCVPKTTDPAILGAVNSIDAEVICEDELVHSVARRCPEIDLDHLSGPALLSTTPGPSE